MRILAVAALVAALGCSDSKSGALTPNAAACDCHVDEIDGYTTLVMSWACYCSSAYGDGCARDMASQCERWSYLHRFDYPACQLSLLSPGPTNGWNEDFYDLDGKLVGARAVSDTGDFKCPSDPSVAASIMRAGRTPEASCEQVACNACTTDPFPCAMADGGTGQ